MIRQRIYDSFFMPSRLGELDALIATAKDRHYSFLPIADLHNAIANDRALPERTLILRHDVDWDLRTARAIFELECRAGIRASWYFRLATADHALMREIAEAGQDVGYHYEELAVLGMREGTMSADQLYELAPRAREMFCENLARLREKTGLPMRIVASHGDFLNRRLGVTNTVLIDSAVRARMDISAEVYDEALQRAVTTHFSDTGGPRYWTAGDPRTAIDNGEPVIYILLHPSSWDSNAPGAVWHIANRLKAEMLYRVRLWKRNRGRE